MEVLRSSRYIYLVQKTYLRSTSYSALTQVFPCHSRDGEWYISVSLTDLRHSSRCLPCLWLLHDKTRKNYSFSAITLDHPHGVSRLQGLWYYRPLSRALLIAFLALVRIPQSKIFPTRRGSHAHEYSLHCPLRMRLKLTAWKICPLPPFLTTMKGQCSSHHLSKNVSVFIRSWFGCTYPLLPYDSGRSDTYFYYINQTKDRDSKTQTALNIHQNHCWSGSWWWQCSRRNHYISIVDPYKLTLGT